MPQKLGQHFLKNKVKLLKIAKAIEPLAGDFIIEIGPGHGELTDAIINQNPNAKIKAIEKDYKLIPLLEEKYKDNKNIAIIPGDVVKDLPKIIDKNYKIIGNIPYYITGKILRTIGELDPSPSITVLLIQKEVAERIVPAKDKYNLLAASIDYFGQAKIIFNIRSKMFSPPPKVDSAVIKIISHHKEIDKNIYFTFVKSVFKQPRKLLINNLSDGLKIDKQIISSALEFLNLDPKIRPQNINYEIILSLIKKIM